MQNQNEASRVLNRIAEQWTVIRIRDYVTEPKITGYRSIHVVVERNARRIEVQLRTTKQQEWAEAIERAAGRLGLALKDGVGPSDVLEYFDWPRKVSLASRLESA